MAHSVIYADITGESRGSEQQLPVFVEIDVQHHFTQFFPNQQSEIHISGVVDAARFVLCHNRRTNGENFVEDVVQNDLTQWYPCGMLDVWSNLRHVRPKKKQSSTVTPGLFVTGDDRPVLLL
uniref:Uncharacterized protein n=1 Tax=Romanomermis culicivorax TaxID=13658 RepID=A0A915KNC7_ROMCU